MPLHWHTHSHCMAIKNTTQTDMLLSPLFEMLASFICKVRCILCSLKKYIYVITNGINRPVLLKSPGRFLSRRDEHFIFFEIIEPQWRHCVFQQRPATFTRWKLLCASRMGWTPITALLSESYSLETEGDDVKPLSIYTFRAFTVKVLYL